MARRSGCFNVRKGVTFSNGKTLDADDIVYSIQLHLSEKSKSAAKVQLSKVTEFKALSPSQFYFKLSEGNADLPVLLGRLSPRCRAQGPY